MSRNVAIVGLGLMGGSVARALLRAGTSSASVRGFDLDPAQAAAAGAAGIDVAPSLADAIHEADVVIVATPLGTLSALLGEVATAGAPDALVMDIASLQRPALQAAEAAGLGARFVSAHPLCGSDASGFAASRPDLYDGAPVTLSPAADASAGMLDRALAFWRGLGALPVVEDPVQHDARMTWVSHLPQVVAVALAAELDEAGIAASALGPGGRDMTRLAASDPRLWEDILRVSGPELAEPLAQLAGRLEHLARALGSGEAAAIADQLRVTGPWRRT